MADDIDQFIAILELSDKTESMDTAPECTSNSVDALSLNGPEFQHNPSILTGSEMQPEDCLDVESLQPVVVNGRRHSIIVPEHFLPSKIKQDVFSTTTDKTDESDEFMEIHHFYSRYGSDSDEEVDNLLPASHTLTTLDNACQSCSSKVERIYKDKKVSKYIVDPCSQCKTKTKGTAPPGEITCESVPVTDASPDILQSHQIRSLVIKMNHALQLSNESAMDEAISELRLKATNSDRAYTEYENAMQRVLSKAILSGKQSVIKVVIAHSNARIFNGDDTDSKDANKNSNLVCEPGNADTKTGDPNSTHGDIFKGQTVLHLAVSRGNAAMVSQMLDRVTEDQATDLVNRQATGRFFTDSRKVPEGQYCLFLAAWMGCTDIFKILIQHGASLDIQDTDGNTILHKLVELSVKKTESDPDKNQARWVDTTKLMCQMVFKFAGLWWRKVTGEIRHRRRSLKEAITYLLYIENNAGFSPMGLAACVGASHIYKIMINSPANKTEHLRYGPITDVSFKMNDIDSALCANNGTSHLESILYNPIDKACEFISLEPISTLVTDKWRHYRKFYYLWLISYVLYMSAFTTYTIVRPVGIGNIEELYLRPVDKFRAILECIMVLGIPWYLYGEIQDIGYPLHRRWPDPWKYIQDGLYRIIQIMFILSLIIWIIVHFAKPIHEDAVLPLCLFFGWIYVIIFTCGSEAFGIFPVMLQRMIFLDLLRFLVIFLLIILSMSTAMYCAFRPTPQVDDYSTFWNTAFSLFKMTIGLQEVDRLTEARHPGIAIFLFVVYAVLGNILLLNVLIAMMNASYAAVSEKAPIYCLDTLQKAYITLLIERRLPQRFSTAQVRIYFMYRC